MSVEAITWALKQPVKHSSAKFVLVALANCSDAVERLAWPSIAYLCEATSQDRKTVIANLKRLVDSGFIEDTGERKGFTKSVIVYRLSSAEIGISKQYQKQDNLDVEVVPFFPTSSTVFPYKQYQNSLEAVPKTGHRTVKNRHRTVKELNTGEIEKSKEAVFVLPNWIDKKHWDVWHLHPKRKNLKAGQKQLAVDQLCQWRDAGIDYAEALKNSATNNWQGLFEPKVALTPSGSKHSGFQNKNYREGVEADGTFA